MLRCIISVFVDFVSCSGILVCTDDCAFKLVTSSSSDGVSDVVAYAVGIRAVGHCNEQMVGLYKFDFVNCNAAVNHQGSDCFKVASSEGFSEFDV